MCIICVQKLVPRQSFFGIQNNSHLSNSEHVLVQYSMECILLRLIVTRYIVHCKVIWIYVFPDKELLGLLSPNFHIHVCL